jgi:cytoskeletal protein RodZ
MEEYMEKRLDQLFKDKLSEHKETPSANVWEKINSQLRHKNKLVWKKRLALAASLVLLISVGIAAYFFIEEATTIPETVTQSNHIQKAEETPESSNPDVLKNDSEDKIESENQLTSKMEREASSSPEANNEVNDLAPIEMKTTAESAETSDDPLPDTSIDLDDIQAADLQSNTLAEVTDENINEPSKNTADADPAPMAEVVEKSPDKKKWR